MPRRLFEFTCSDNHTNEHLVEDTVQEVVCQTCSKNAHRIISTPRIKLEGITGAFPSAYDAWARKHEEGSRIAKKKAAEHGPTPLPR